MWSAPSRATSPAPRPSSRNQYGEPGSRPEQRPTGVPAAPYDPRRASSMMSDPRGAPGVGSQYYRQRTSSFAGAPQAGAAYSSGGAMGSSSVDRGGPAARQHRYSVGGALAPSAAPSDRPDIYSPSGFGAEPAPSSLPPIRRRSISGNLGTAPTFPPTFPPAGPSGRRPPFADESRKLPPPIPSSYGRPGSFSAGSPLSSSPESYGYQSAYSSPPQTGSSARPTSGLRSPNLPPADLSRHRLPNPPTFKDPASASRPDRIVLPPLSATGALPAASLAREPKIAQPPLSSGGIRQRAFATRHQCTPEQEQALRHRYQANNYIDPAEADRLASDIGMTSKEVKRWFSNRRQAARRNERQQALGNMENQ